MTNDAVQNLAAVLRKRFPYVDIRSDQGDTVRLLSPTLAAACRHINGVFRAKVVSLTASELDYSDELVEEFEDSSPEELADDLASYFPDPSSAME